MPLHHLDELRIALCGPDRCGMANRPDDKARNPEPQAEPDGRRKRAIGDGDRARRSAEQDRLGQRPMHRRVESHHGFMR